MISWPWCDFLLECASVRGCTLGGNIYQNQGDWIDSMASRFIDELPEDYLEKNSFSDDGKNEIDDFEFNQDFEVEEGTRSPGWIRYQKRIK